MRSTVKNLVLIGVWIALYAALWIAMPESFGTLRNFETILRQTIIVGLAAVGMTYIIVAGAIDLSVGSLVALVTVAIALGLQSGLPPWLAGSVGLVVGVIGGLLNGLLITKLRVSAFIVTLATLLAMRGLAKGLANDQKVDAPMTWLSDLTAALGPDQRWMLMPSGAWLLLAVAVVASFGLQRTVFGRHAVAVGSNEATARMCGVSVDAVRIKVFALAGLAFGLAGLMQFGRLTVGDPTVAAGLELSVIAAVVIGGASLSGGEGSIFGSLIGAFIMTTVASGASQLGLPNWIQEIVTGTIILGAVALDRWRHRRVVG